MKVAMIINENASAQQLNDNHLLCLALLNFDHHVYVVFINKSLQNISASPDILKQWMSLQFYGAKALLQLNTASSVRCPEVTGPCQVIGLTDFDQLINDMDLIL